MSVAGALRSRLLAMTSALRSSASAHRPSWRAASRPVSSSASRTFHGVDGLVGAEGGGQGGHVVAEPGDLGQDLVGLSHRGQHLQPLDLVGELGPGAEAGLPGVADRLVGEVEGLGQPPAVPAQVDQPPGGRRRRPVVAARSTAASR